MPRPFRLEHAGAFWHIYNRGVDRRDIFLDDADRHRFIELLGDTQLEFRWRIHTYTLMTNHYHLLVETPEPTLSRGMQQLDGDYAAAFNRAHRRTGPLFDGRFKSQLVESECYLLELARYIVLNPVRAHMVDTPGQWPWSSYHVTTGLRGTPAWVETRAILDRFDPWDREAAARLYREFVADGIGLARSPWEDLRAGLYLGSETFIARIEELTAIRKRTRTEPALQRRLRSIDIVTIQQTIETTLKISLTPKKWSNEPARLAFATLARSEAIATFTEIAAVLAMTPPGARALARRAMRMEAADKSFRCTLDDLRRQISQFIKRV